METTRAAWASKAEAAIRMLRDVEGVSVQLDGDDVREIHVLTRSTRPAKQIVRDVQTVLLTKFNHSIDYRVVSIAYTTGEADAKPTDNKNAALAPVPLPPPPVALTPPVTLSPPIMPPPPVTLTPVAPPAPTPTFEASAPGGAAAAAPRSESRAAESGERASAPRPAAADERLRFVSVNLYVAGTRTQAQVELRWKGITRLGSASGWSSRMNAHRLVAGAALAALKEFLAEDVPLAVHEVELVRLGRKRVVVASLALLEDRREKMLVGSCPVEQDVHQAVVLATLSASNRIFGGLRAQEPTEYIVRPTST